MAFEIMNIVRVRECEKGIRLLKNCKFVGVGGFIQIDVIFLMDVLFSYTGGKHLM